MTTAPAKQMRVEHASAEVNDAELVWWNRNAGLVNSFWEMDDRLSGIIRGHYLRRARKFFLVPGRESLVLELGCGSGWVGQAIAGNGIRIVGSDFSEAQLEQARMHARRRGLEAVTRYELGNSHEWPREIGEADGVLIHAFLHHLDGAELNAFFDELVARVRLGAKVWIMEPTYVAGLRPAWQPKYLTRKALQLADYLQTRMNKWFAAEGNPDEPRREAFMALMQKADENGWWLSPKEVPFSVEEMDDLLKGRLTVKSSFWSGIYSIGWAFETNLVRVDRVKQAAIRLYWPILAICDRLLAKDERFLAAVLKPPGHAFRVWECVAPSKR